MKTTIFVVGALLFSSHAFAAKSDLNCQNVAESAFKGALGLQDGDFSVNSRYATSEKNEEYQTEVYPMVVKRHTPERYFVFYVTVNYFDGKCVLYEIQNSRYPGEES